MSDNAHILDFLNSKVLWVIFLLFFLMFFCIFQKMKNKVWERLF